MMPLKSIAVIGDGLRGALPAAYLAARCKASGTRITVVPTKKPEPEKDEIVARPNIRHLHQLLKIPEKHILGPAKGRRIYAFDVEGESGSTALPFGAFGKSYKGAAFAHLLARVSSVKPQKKHPLKPIAHYNLNLRLHSLGAAAPYVEQADFGYVFPRAHYTGMMQHYAQNLGADFTASPCRELIKDNASGYIKSVATGGGTLGVDCVIDARDIGNENAQTLRSGWDKNCLHLPTDMGMQNLELYRLQAAMERMSNFMPDQSFNAYELSEFNRLTALEAEHIADMQSLLNKGVNGAQTRPSLTRKIDVFAQRGRIPSEDYEVFTPPEWRAALMGAGLTPRHYDRLADGFSEAELHVHIKRVSQDIETALRGTQGTR